MPDWDVLYFLTIPKTASTTLYHILANYFPPAEVAPVQPLRGLIGTPVGEIWRYRLVGGHYFYNISPVLGCKPIYITMLRDPVERALSHYAHIRRAEKHYAHNRLITQTLPEFVADERNLALYSNLQVRYLGQQRDIRRIYQRFSRAELECGKFMEALEGYAPDGFDDETMLTTARERLEDFAFVGIRERFDESVMLLCSHFGWTPPARYDRLMVNPNPLKIIDIDPSVELKIRNANILDYRLYQYVSQQFSQRLDEYKVGYQR